jgi:hypothetical protein
MILGKSGAHDGQHGIGTEVQFGEQSEFTNEACSSFTTRLTGDLCELWTKGRAPDARAKILLGSMP